LLSFVQYLLFVLAGLPYSKVPHPGGASPCDLTTRQVCSAVKKKSEHTSSSIASHNASLAMPERVCRCGSRVSAAEVLEATATNHVDCGLVRRATGYQRPRAPSLPSCAIRITLKLRRRLRSTTSFTAKSSDFLQICCSTRTQTGQMRTKSPPLLECDD
jgi:hypothetical protein